MPKTCVTGDSISALLLALVIDIYGALYGRFFVAVYYAGDEAFPDSLPEQVLFVGLPAVAFLLGLVATAQAVRWVLRRPGGRRAWVRTQAAAGIGHVAALIAAVLMV